MERDLTSYSPAVKNQHNACARPSCVVGFRLLSPEGGVAPARSTVQKQMSSLASKNPSSKRLESNCGASKPMWSGGLQSPDLQIKGWFEPLLQAPLGHQKSAPPAQLLQGQQAGNVTRAPSLPQLSLEQRGHCREMKPASIFPVL